VDIRCREIYSIFSEVLFNKKTVTLYKSITL
jgi:hypothetical protein